MPQGTIMPQGTVMSAEELLQMIDDAIAESEESDVSICRSDEIGST